VTARRKPWDRRTGLEATGVLEAVILAVDQTHVVAGPRDGDHQGLLARARGTDLEGTVRKHRPDGDGRCVTAKCGGDPWPCPPVASAAALLR
jgi:hypothetical protein